MGSEGEAGWRRCESGCGVGGDEAEEGVVGICRGGLTVLVATRIRIQVAGLVRSEHRWRDWWRRCGGGCGDYRGGLTGYSGETKRGKEASDKDPHGAERGEAR